MNFLYLLYQIGKLLRLKDWLDKLEIFFIAFLILSFSSEDFIYFREFLIIVIYGIGLAVYGYVLNSWSDFKFDLEAKKINISINIKKNNLLIIVFLSGLFSLIIPVLLGNIYVLYFNIIVFVLVTLYSLPPIYLKARGFIGSILVPAFCQGSAQFLFFLWIVPNENTTIFLLSFWLLVINLYMQICHQISDFNNDLMSKIKTWVVDVGLGVAKASINILVLLILLFLIVPLFIIKDMYIGLFMVFFIFIYYVILFAQYFSVKKS